MRKKIFFFILCHKALINVIMWLLFLYRVSQLKLLQDQQCTFIENLLSNLKSLATNFCMFFLQYIYETLRNEVEAIDT